jgi:hypothetical protein
MTQPDHDPASVKAELGRLISEFFRAVSFEEGEAPPYGNIHGLFVEAGLIVKNTASTPEIYSVGQFIESRLAMFRSGEMTCLYEMELLESTEVFGQVAHRFNSYAKSGTTNGVPFTARGMISTQFIQTPAGWRISAMAWDDERPGLSIPERYEPKQASQI